MGFQFLAVATPGSLEDRFINKNYASRTGLPYGKCYQNIFRGILYAKGWKSEQSTYITNQKHKPMRFDQSYGYPKRQHHSVEVLEVSTWHQSVLWCYIYIIDNSPQTKTWDAYYSASVSRSRPRSYFSSLPLASNHLSAIKKNTNLVSTWKLSGLW